MDPSHIIRTIEYWDIESRRYPQYEHIAVLVAENVSTRFLNVVLRISGQIPLMVLQVNVLDVNGVLALVVTKVLDMMRLGADAAVRETPTDLGHWESHASATGLRIVKALHQKILAVEAEMEMNYTKHYIGLSRQGKIRNFIEFRPKKGAWVRVDFRIPEDPDIDDKLENSGLNVMSYDRGKYRVNLSERDIEENGDILESLIEKARNQMLGPGES